MDERDDVLIAVLELLRSEVQYLHRQHGWIIAVAETLQGQSQHVAQALKLHPFYDQGPRQDVEITLRIQRTIDELILRLKDRN